MDNWGNCYLWFIFLLRLYLSVSSVQTMFGFEDFCHFSDYLIDWVGSFFIFFSLRQGCIFFLEVRPPPLKFSCPNFITAKEKKLAWGRKFSNGWISWGDLDLDHSCKSGFIHITATVWFCDVSSQVCLDNRLRKVDTESEEVVVWGRRFQSGIFLATTWFLSSVVAQKGT